MTFAAISSAQPSADPRSVPPGSHAAEVVARLGPPAAKTEHEVARREEWSYPGGKVRFDGGLSVAAAPVVPDAAAPADVESEAPRRAGAGRYGHDVAGHDVDPSALFRDIAREARAEEQQPPGGMPPGVPPGS